MESSLKMYYVYIFVIGPAGQDRQAVVGTYSFLEENIAVHCAGLSENYVDIFTHFKYQFMTIQYDL